MSKIPSVSTVSSLQAELDALDEALVALRLDRDSRIDYDEEWDASQVRMIV